jgi:ribosomal protein S6E (S10)
VIDMPGYEFRLTGGSDSAGFPMRPDIEGSQRKQILAGTGVGVTNKLRKPNPKKKGWRSMKGMRIRKTVAGNTVYAKTAQVNLKVLKEGREKLGGADEPAPAEAKKDEPKKETPEAPKKEVKKEERKVEKSESKPKPKEVKKVEDGKKQKEDVADHAEEMKDGAEVVEREIPEDQIQPISGENVDMSEMESDAVESASEHTSNGGKKEEHAPEKKEEKKEEVKKKEEPEKVDEDVAEAEKIDEDIKKDEEEVKKADEEIEEIEKELKEGKKE